MNAESDLTDDGRLKVESDDQDLQLAEILEKYLADLEQGAAPDRQTLLARHPGLSAELTSCLDSLEIAQRIGGQFRDDTDGDTPKSQTRIPTQLGDFRVSREIGRGGMGIVYEAEQLSMSRMVALKILPLAALIDPQGLARFQNEVRAAGTLDHPHIIQVYSVGEERGVHYFAMQLIRGKSLAWVIEQLRLAQSGRGAGSIATAVHDSGEHSGQAPSGANPTSSSEVAEQARQADASTLVARDGETAPDRKPRYSDFCRSVAQLGIQAAEALHHAHEHGIVHRDVKPGNLLVDDTARLWVTDFGLARIEADARLTLSRDWVGTLRYMAPEQALGHKTRVDHRVDVYSLGATLYELLLLRPARDSDDREEMLKQCAAAQPVALRKIDPRIPTELVTIVGKAMEFEPTDRYATAQAMADDLERFLNKRPILAHPPTLRQRLVKWSHRHVGVVWTTLLALTALVIVFGGSAMMIAASRDRADHQRLQAENQRSAAVTERNMARQQQYYAEMVASQTDVAQRNPGGLYSRLINHLPMSGDEDRREWEWYYLMSICRPEERTLLYPGLRPYTAWSADGQHLGAPGAIWRTDTGERVRRFNTSSIARGRVAWSPDGQKFAWSVSRDEDAIYIWDRREDKVDRFAGLAAVAWSPNGSQIARAPFDSPIDVVDVDSGKVQWTAGAAEDVLSMTWSPDGQLLAVVVDEKGLLVWDVQQRTQAIDRRGEVRSLSWRPQGDVLAVCERDEWYLIDPSDWSVTREVELVRGECLAWSPDGEQIAVAHGETVTLWDAAAEAKLRELHGHGRPVISVSWHPEGRRLVTADQYREIKVWDLDRNQQPLRIDAEQQLRSIAWLDDNQTLVTVAEKDGSSTWWNVKDGSLERRPKLAVKPPYQLSADRRLAAVHLKKEHAISVLDTASGATRALLRLPAGRALGYFALSGDGSKLLTQTGASGDYVVRFWDVDHERQEASCRVPTRTPFRSAIWSASGARVAAVGSGDAGENASRVWLDHVHVFNVAEGKRIRKYQPAWNEGITSMTWSADEQFLAVGTLEGAVEVFDPDTGTRRFTQKIHRQHVSALAWHPRAKRLACASQDSEVKLVTADKGQELLTFSLPEGSVVGLTWSPDGQRLAAAASVGNIHIWDASRAYEMSVEGPRRGELAWAYYDRATGPADQQLQEALREFLERAPDTLDFWESRGAVLAHLGEFEHSVAEFSKGVEPDLSYAFEATQSRAFALLGVGDLDRFRETCVRLVDEFQDSPVPSNRNRVAWLCSLATNKLVDTNQVVQLARDVHPLDEDDVEDLQTLIVGASLYRDGQRDEAVRVLTELTEKLSGGGDFTDRYRLACATYFLSLARFDMGHTFQAQRLLDEANRLADEYPPSPYYWYWNRPVVVLEALRQQATSLMGE